MTFPTARQKEMLDVIRRYTEAHGYAPTQREIGNAMGIGSTNGVSCHQQSLERKGLIRRDPMKSRAIVVVGHDVELRDPVEASEVIEVKVYSMRPRDVS